MDGRLTESAKHPPFISFMELGSVTEVKLEQPKKASFSRIVTELGMSIEVSDLQYWKQRSGTTLMALGSLTDSNAWHIRKHAAPIPDTEEGMSMEVRPVHQAKQPSPIYATDSGILKEVRLPQPSKRPLGNSS